ncbi:Glutathione S-transferase [Aphelenchoides bicaudatus]|nr:Glutathione S-transferase [Aphelenchoides bicaudatus]
MEKPVLFSYWMSSCSWRVRAALEFKQIDYELRTIDLGEGENRTEEYLSLNPTGFVPTFLFNGNVICESMAICEYIEEEFPGPKFLPGDAANKALIRSLCMNIVAGIQPLQIPRVYEKISNDANEQMEFIHNVIDTGFSAIEKRLQKCAGKYSVGDELTLADLFLFPQAYNATDKFGMDLSKYKIISRIIGTLSELPLIQKTHAANQPDNPANWPSDTREST